jgi:hypothetical protein
MRGTRFWAILRKSSMVAIKDRDGRGMVAKKKVE